MRDVESHYQMQTTLRPFWIILSLLLVFNYSFSQNYTIFKGDTVNRVKGEGKWMSFDANHLPYWVSWYVGGKIDSLIYMTQEGLERDVSVPLREYPSITDPNDSLDTFLKKNINRKNLIFDYTGRVSFSCILEPDGTISDVRILFGLSKEYNDEVERVVKKAPSHLFPVEIAIDFQAPVFYVYSYTF